MPFIDNIPLAISTGLVFSAALSGITTIGVFLAYGHDAKDLAKKYEGQQPYTAGTLMALVRLTWASLATIALIGIAYTIRIVLLKPLIVLYPKWAFYLDMGVYLFLIVVLITPAVYMLAARKKLEDMEDRNAGEGEQW